MENPFYFRELPLEAPFCNRTAAMKELLSHAQNKANVVLYSPRRYGKTSMVRRVQNRIKTKGVAILYADFYGVDSIEDLSGRLAACVYEISRDNESLMKKIARFFSSWRPVLRPDSEYGVSLTVELATRQRGTDLLEITLKELGEFIENHSAGCHIVFDEFQETVELKESLKIEGIMRSHIQKHSNASYFFVGSRRRILQDIFNNRKRAFYQSAINYPLNPLPQDEAVDFIIEQFKRGGKFCRRGIAEKIVKGVEGYPYYIQRIPYAIYEMGGKNITEDDYTRGFRKAIEEERPIFEAFLQSLSLQQIKLLSALAEKPTESPFASSYMADHALGSIGGIQGALKKLLSLDYIEKRNGLFCMVDPVFGIWLQKLKGYR